LEEGGVCCDGVGVVVRLVAAATGVAVGVGIAVAPAYAAVETILRSGGLVAVGVGAIRLAPASDWRRRRSVGHEDDLVVAFFPMEACSETREMRRCMDQRSPLSSLFFFVQPRAGYVPGSGAFGESRFDARLT